MIEIIFSVIGFIGIPVYTWYVYSTRDAIETISSQPRKPVSKLIWFLLAVTGGGIGWGVGKGLDKLWEILTT